MTKPVLDTIHRQENLQTAILLFEGVAQSFLLFIFNNSFYAAYKLAENQLAPLLFLDYFKEISQSEGKLDLYRVSPVLFKALLTLGQIDPKIFVTSDLIEIERLLVRVDQKKEEAFLLLEMETQVNLFYFTEGALCDGYLEETEEMREESCLRDKLLVCAYSPNEKPVSIVLYEEIVISPEKNCEAAEKEIFAHVFADKVALGTHEAKPAPLPEMLCLKENNLLSLDERPQKSGNNVEKPSSEKVADPENLLEKKSPGTEHFSGQKRNDLWLEVLNGERVGLLIRFASERLSLGRGRVDVRLNDPQISRYHAELTRSQSQLVVTDQHSTNGLFVNEKKVMKKEVVLDDIIRLGNTFLKVIKHG